MHENDTRFPEDAARRRDGGPSPRVPVFGDYTARDAVILFVIALVVAVCGVLGVSYVMGKGWQSFDAPTTAILIAVATVVSAVIIAVLEEGIFRLSTRGAVAPGGMQGAKGEYGAEGEQDAEGVCGAEGACGALGGQNAEGTSAAAVLGAQGPGAEGGPGEQGERRLRDRAARALACVTPKWNVRSIAIFSLIMVVFWLPWLIANYPGGTYWDTYYQIFQCYPENHPIAIIPYAECYDNTLTDAYLCDHHPFLVTLLYGAFGMASDALTGNWMAGVFAFVCLQGALSIVTFTAAVAYVRERRCPVVLCFAAYVFFCVMPFVSTWQLCMVKDSLFGFIYIPYLLMLFEAVRTRGGSLASLRAVLFAVLGLLLCITKKQGLYMVVPVAVIGMLLYRSQWRVFLTQALLSVVVVCVVFPMVVFPLVNVAPGGKQEVLGTLFQQTARYVWSYEDEVTPEQREAIDALLEYENIRDQYTFDFQDEVKYRYNLDATTGDIVRYLETWAQQGAAHPESYVAAVMSIAGYYVAPCGPANIRMVTVDTKMGEDQRYMLWNPDELDPLRLGLDEAYKGLCAIPGVNVPFLLVTYVFWLPTILMFCMWRRRVRCGLLFVPAVILLGFCVIAPVYDARYCVPLLNAAPLMLCMVAALVRERAGAVRKV